MVTTDHMLRNCYQLHKITSLAQLVGNGSIRFEYLLTIKLIQEVLNFLIEKPRRKRHQYEEIIISRLQNYSHCCPPFSSQHDVWRLLPIKPTISNNVTLCALCSDNTIILRHQLHGLLEPTGLKLSYAQRFRCRLLPNLNFGNPALWTAQPSSMIF
jgi:hypothetical protein